MAALADDFYRVLNQLGCARCAECGGDFKLPDHRTHRPVFDDPLDVRLRFGVDADGRGITKRRGDMTNQEYASALKFLERQATEVQVELFLHSLEREP